MLESNSIILVDSHVHIHRCFDLGEFLFSAARNFNRAAATLCPGQPYRVVLILTEGTAAREFDYLCQLADQRAERGGWLMNRTHESRSLIAAHEKLGSMIILAGRQIVCDERVEILAVGTRSVFEDGIGLRTAIERIRADGALAILPWGFGKWTGRRGRLVRQVLEHGTPDELCLGDNGGRLALWPEPAEFGLAKKLGILVLPGSDPLPFPSGVSRVASYGLAVAGHVTDTEPARDLIAILRDPSVRIDSYGRLERPLRFLRNQLAMQMLKLRKEMDHS